MANKIKDMVNKGQRVPAVKHSEEIITGRSTIKMKQVKEIEAKDTGGTIKLICSALHGCTAPSTPGSPAHKFYNHGDIISDWPADAHFSESFQQYTPEMEQEDLDAEQEIIDKKVADRAAWEKGQDEKLQNMPQAVRIQIDKTLADVERNRQVRKSLHSLIKRDDPAIITSAR